MTNDQASARLSRRSLLQGAACSGVGLGAVALAARPADAAALAVENGSAILFQGDSITDAGRDRRNTRANDSRGLGRGYAMLISSWLLSHHPEKKLKCLNRGISGNKVPDLDRRWQADCLDLKPAVLSILIGVNDIWHKLNGKYDGTVGSYEKGLEALLRRTREALPDTRIVLCEPFVLRCGAVNDSWFPEFDERRAACQRVGERQQCVWVPFQAMYDRALRDAAPAYWAGDGVHPSLAGHALMAKTWLDVVLSS